MWRREVSSRTGMRTSQWFHTHALVTHAAGDSSQNGVAIGVRIVAIETSLRSCRQ